VLDTTQAQDLDDLALRSRPICCGQQAAERSHREQALAKKAYCRTLPCRGYMIMPSGKTSAMPTWWRGNNLPWLNHRKHDARSQRLLAGDEQDADLASSATWRSGKFRSACGAEAAQKLAHLYHEELRPQQKQRSSRASSRLRKRQD